MEKNLKKPEWVKVIFVWVALFASFSLYSIYSHRTGFGSTADEKAIPLGIVYWLQNFALPTIQLIAATLLWMRIAFNRWLFLAVVICNGAFGLFANYAHGKFPLLEIIGGVLILSAPGILITLYTFKLQEAGYYKRSSAGDLAQPSSITELQNQRPFWLTLLLIFYGLFVVPMLGTLTYIYYKDSTNPYGEVTLIITYALMSLSLLGIWKLKMWGAAVGILGILFLCIRIYYVHAPMRILWIFTPSLALYLLVYLWFKIKSKTDIYG